MRHSVHVVIIVFYIVQSNWLQELLTCLLTYTQTEDIQTDATERITSRMAGGNK